MFDFSHNNHYPFQDIDLLLKTIIREFRLHKYFALLAEELVLEVWQNTTDRAEQQLHISRAAADYISIAEENTYDPLLIADFLRAWSAARIVRSNSAYTIILLLYTEIAFEVESHMNHVTGKDISRSGN